MPLPAFRSLAVVAALLAVAGTASADGGRDLVIDAPGQAIRVRVIAFVDGKVVEDRRNSFVAELARNADKDQDKKISPVEFAEAMMRLAIGYAPPGQSSEKPDSGDSTPEGLREALVAALGPLMEVVVQPQPLVDRLELFAALDADGDGFVTAAELGASEHLFSVYDADGDGTLNQPELAPTEPLQPQPVRSGADFPPGRFPFRWETPAGEPDAVIEIKLIGRAFGRPKVTVAKKSDGLALASETRKASFDFKDLALDLDAAPARITSEDVKRFYLLQLRQRDTDKNGYLNEAEFAGLGLPGLDFRTADVNGDGMLYPDELTGKLDALIARESSRVRVEATFERQPLFTKLDADGDGRLSRRELRNAKNALASADVDGDGKIGLAEFGGRYRLSFSVPNPLDAAGPRMAADFAAMTRGPSSRSNDGPPWFAAMDRNADGDLDRREFLGTAEQFAKLDADGDGLLSPEEAEEGSKQSTVSNK